MMERAPIYLDHNASTPVPARVRQAMMSALEEGFGNPSATHAYGRTARALDAPARPRPHGRAETRRAGKGGLGGLSTRPNR